MKRYRSKPPPKLIRSRSDDGWDDYNHMDKSITVYEVEPKWMQLGILGPDGQPLEYLDAMEPIGFLHEFFGEDEE